MIPHILVIGLNHSTAPVEIRERITFPSHEEGKAIRTMARVEGVEETIILSTCNRAEIVMTTVDPEASPEKVVQAIADFHSIDPQDFREFLYFKSASDAVQHVFRVTASLDSMVLGEPQILGQVKESYRRAVQANTTGPVLNRLMHRAFFTAKRIRTETGVGRAAVSVAYVAVELARKILGDLKHKKILLIGAGDMAELAARHLAGHVEKPILVVNRTFETACTLAKELCGDALPMDQLEEALVQADVTITSTASCEALIRKDLLKAVMRRRRNRPIFLIDIAIPRDVDPEANDIDGVYLYNIDDLQAVVSENVGERSQEALKGERIVAEEVIKFIGWTRTLEAAPTIVALKDKLEMIRKGELARLNGKLAELGPTERESVEIITRSIINKIAHDPIVFLKKAGSSAKRNFYLATAQSMFNLDQPTTESRDRDEESSPE